MFEKKCNFDEHIARSCQLLFFQTKPFACKHKPCIFLKTKKLESTGGRLWTMFLRPRWFVYRDVLAHSTIAAAQWAAFFWHVTESGIPCSFIYILHGMTCWRFYCATSCSAKMSTWCMQELMCPHFLPVRKSDLGFLVCQGWEKPVILADDLRHVMSEPAAHWAAECFYFGVVSYIFLPTQSIPEKQFDVVFTSLLVSHSFLLISF